MPLTSLILCVSDHLYHNYLDSRDIAGAILGVTNHVAVERFIEHAISKFLSQKGDRILLVIV